MKNSIFALALLLSACGHDAQTGLAKPVRIPDLPTALATKATSLPPITDNSMGGIVLHGAEDDMQYNNVAHQLNAVIDIYNCVKESINKKKEIKCL